MDLAVVICSRAKRDLISKVHKSRSMAKTPDIRPKARRGFAAMSPELQRKLSAKGGVAVPAKKRSFSQDRDLAVRAVHSRWSGFRSSSDTTS
jgi:general stress protein YciG